MDECLCLSVLFVYFEQHEYHSMLSTVSPRYQIEAGGEENSRNAHCPRKYTQAVTDTLLSLHLVSSGTESGQRLSVRAGVNSSSAPRFEWGLDGG